MSNGTWEVTCHNMGTQLMTLNETTNKILMVKNILKIFKNHAKRSPAKRWDICMKANLKESKDNFKSPFG